MQGGLLRAAQTCLRRRRNGANATIARRVHRVEIPAGAQKRKYNNQAYDCWRDLICDLTGATVRMHFAPYRGHAFSAVLVASFVNFGLNGDKTEDKHSRNQEGTRAQLQLAVACAQHATTVCSVER